MHEASKRHNAQGQGATNRSPSGCCARKKARRHIFRKFSIFNTGGLSCSYIWSDSSRSEGVQKGPRGANPDRQNIWFSPMEVILSPRRKEQFCTTFCNARAILGTKRKNAESNCMGGIERSPPKLDKTPLFLKILFLGF